jgi:EAL and modified HD-GYP domain-containing signal transduction protein
MSSVHVARQPIFELGRGLYGYELLYRRDTSTDYADSDHGYERRGHRQRAARRRDAESRAAALRSSTFRAASCSIESWELFEAHRRHRAARGVECDYETLSACRSMVNAGYKLALDDYIPDERMRPLVELASVVKIDVLNRPHADLRGVANHLRPSGVRLLAERVETATVRDMCTDLGYELFQGYLFSRPETLTKTDVSASHLAVMRLLNLLQDPGTPDTALEAAFQSDIALCYKLLRIVNAAAMGGRESPILHAVRTA